MIKKQKQPGNKKTAGKVPTKIKTEWDLTPLYKDAHDPKIESDVVAIEKVYLDFAEEYKNKTDYLENEDALHSALTAWERLTEQAGAWKPALYFNYLKEVESHNEYANGQFTKIVARLTKAANEIIFFELNLGKIKPALQEQFLASVKLAHFKHFLQVIFDQSRYRLSESEEKVLNLMSLPAYTMWVEGQEKLLNSQTVTFKGKKLPITEAAAKVPELPKVDRRKMHQAVTAVTKGISTYGEGEINALLQYKKIEDELRGFKEPYSSTILRYQNNEPAVENLIKTIENHYHISHRFFKLKAKILKEKKLVYPDRYAKIGSVNKKVTLNEAVDVLSRSFRSVAPRYEAIFKEMLEQGKIDMYPKKGKRGGAFCSSSVGTPVFILTNFTNDISSVATIGHEMGHAFHFLMSKPLSPLYQEPVISIAEVASTLFENFVFDEMVKDATPKEKIVMLHNKIQDDIASIFNQIAYFQFETALHKRVRIEGTVSAAEIAKMMSEHFSRYLGPAVKVVPDDGYFFVRLKHIRYFFYVYSYAYGTLISKTMYAQYLRDKNYLTKIEQFLSAGTSKAPEQIFKDIGIDTSKPEFFEAGLKSIEEDIIELERLTRLTGK